MIGGNQPTDENQSIDLLHFMQDKKDQIRRLMTKRVPEGPRKVQFSANLVWVKSRAIKRSSIIDPDERFDIFANFVMKPLMNLR